MSGLSYDGIIFDFDGVLIDSEYVGNLHLAEYLTAAGTPISIEETLHRFMGLSGQAFIDAIEAWRERPLPADFAAVRAQEDERLLKEGIAALAGAVDFVRALPEALPKAIASSSRSRWIRAHLDHLGLRARFEPMIFSGHEHVARGKPAPDLYLYAAQEMGVDIERTVILEDSPVGVTGALASGARHRPLPRNALRARSRGTAAGAWRAARRGQLRRGGPPGRDGGGAAWRLSHGPASPDP